ncbi:metallopeptidase PepO [Streptococcus equi subsp. zooepidemicus MGCS10565]|uniref:Metallopeptidase PepO n=2 Tax=Streptococcus equi subsp. zooepidemicus TaxID=40041 RepID=B4U069_STREM|nr:M13-type metalloendopeptidase [Streptococcus equi]ACG61512.1 metallopeptidase PepO [Streptococcus equi subsp. zooepidemicus MGCS10565]MDI6036509.1 M13-type metalloendopeptidase [Streptococcus equi subsp. zooepidemicus]QZA21207.1 endopeptidase [Streptococcus equi subsp. zooepidemicus]SQE95054.1 endopeptidase O [Streptococcus equi subsp. zooepidemicus]SQF53197.1 endopeptidase O [Streptococcus equi subsp. zooepidemicus]
MTTYQEDFYQAVNGKWAETAVIPDDKPRTGGFSDLADEIEDLMLTTTDAWLAGEHVPNDAILENFVKFHRLVADYDKRDQVGVAPALDLIEEYKALGSFAEFASKVADYELNGKPNQFPFSVAPDFMNAQLNVLWAEAPGLILPDTTYYAKDNDKGKELLAIWRGMQEELLPKFGFSHEEAKDLLDKVITLDKQLADYVLSREEYSEYAKLYHPYDWAEFTKLVPELPLDDIFTVILGEVPDKVVVPEERFWTEFAADYYSEKNWELLKAWLVLTAAGAYHTYLTDEIRVLSGVYSRALSGTPQAMDKKKAAYYLAQGPFNQALGLWYAGEKFSPEAKADVEHKVAKMIEVYKSRLETADWLAPATREKAITKLNVITPHIGYPEKLPETYAKKVIDDKLSLVENAQNLAKISIAHSWSKWNKPVDRSEWHMPANMVNAYYDPQQNQIVFPAAILQAPFYSLSQSSSANYGGIGAVIAHEISHAFDTNGASFDEHGSLKNWWTDEDYAAFKERTDKIVEQFDGLDSYGAKVNGKLTVSENVADLGGVACALEAAQSEPDFSARDFFINFATIWRMKAREEFMQMMASIDVHAPGQWRTNVTLTNFDEFHQEFNIKEGDPMWRAPEDRVIIW